MSGKQTVSFQDEAMRPLLKAEKINNDQMLLGTLKEH